ncbi:MAG: FliO/MopB family protein [Solirubrobacterales bacterium]|nr:FliO/MopB family protein [Solirubrobacterales bacterium]
MPRSILAPILVAGFTLALPAATFAATVTGPGEDTPLNLPADAPRHAASGGGSGNLVRTIVGLAIVIGVIYGVAWVLRQVKDSREARVSGAGLQHAATIPLGPNRALHLVRAGRELVLVGSAEHGVVPIRTYTEAEAIAVGLIAPEEDEGEDGPRPSAGPPRSRTFVDRLRELTTRS